MWPFDSEDEQDLAVLEFEQVASGLIEAAPDSGTGLSMLRDAYSSYEFKDKETAKSKFLEYSSQARKKFEDVNPFTFDEVIQYSPIPIDEADGQDPIEAINKWEKANTEFLESTEDLTYLQYKSQLERGVKDLATLKRREELSKDYDYYWGPVSWGIDKAYRAADGSIGGIADLIGADSIRDYFQERTNPEADDDFSSALAGGVGQLAGALGAGAVGGPAGAMAYLGAQGLGSVRNVVEKSIEAEGSAAEIAAAGSIEFASQAAQTLVGGNIFGQAGKALATGTTKQLGSKLSSIATAGAAESITEGLGQVASNIAEEVGTNRDIPLTRGVATSAALGGILGAGARGLEVGLAKPIDELHEQIVNMEGTPPPPKEPGINVNKSVEVSLNDSDVAATLEDGSTLVVADGRLHFSKDGKVRQATSEAFVVDTETAAALADLTAKDRVTPDDSPVILDVDDGKLFVEHPYISDDGKSFTEKPTPGKRVEVKADKLTAGVSGKHVVGVSPVERDAKGVRRPNFYITTNKVSDSAGADKITRNTYEHAYAKKLRDKYGPDIASDRNLETTQATVDADGNVVEERLGLIRYYRFGRDKGYKESEAIIAEKGLFGALAWLKNIPEGTTDVRVPYVLADLQNAATEIRRSAKIEAERTGVDDDFIQATDLEMEVEQLRARLGHAPGATLAGFNLTEPKTVSQGGTNSEAALSAIEASLVKDADKEIKSTLGKNASIKKFTEDVTKAQEQVAQVEKQLNKPGIAKAVEAEAELNVLKKEEAKLSPEVKKAIEAQEVAAEIKEIEKQLVTPQEVASEIDKATKALDKATAPVDNTKAQERLKQLKARAKEIGVQASKPLTPEQKAAASFRARIRNLEKQIKEREADPNFSDYDKDIMRVSMETLYQTKEFLNKAKDIRKNKLNSLTPEDVNTLRTLYEAMGKTQDGKARHKVARQIFKLESKYLPADKSRANMLFNYWRGNALSGPDTLIRNLGANFFNQLFTIADYGVTGFLNDITFGLSGSDASVTDGFAYAKGVIAGSKKGIVEAADILAGREYGRAKFDEFGKDFEEPFTILSAKNLKSPGKFLIKAPIELARRGLAAGDVWGHRSAQEGTARLMAHLAAKQDFVDSTGVKRKRTGEEVRQFVENTLYNTEARAKEISAEIEAEAKVLESVGIPMSRTEKASAFYQRMELKRAEADPVYGPVVDQMSLRSIYMQEPTGIAGLTHRLITQAINSSETKVLGHNVAGTVIPFTRTIANVVNGLMDFTPPLGYWGAIKRGRARAKVQAKIDAKPDITLTKEEIATLNNQLEQRQILGRAITGTAAIGALAAAAIAESDKEDPAIQFVGNIPKGKYKEYRDRGIPAYSMKVFGTWIPLQYTPAALLPAIVAPIVEAKKNGKDYMSVGFAGLLGCVGAISEMSFLKTLGDIFKYVTETDAATEAEGTSSAASDIRRSNLMKSVAANWARPFIPSVGLLSNIGRWGDETPNDTFNNFGAKMFANIPVISSMGEDRPALNIFGEEIKRRFSDRTAIGSFITWENQDPVFLWMAKSGYRLEEPGQVMSLTRKSQKAIAEQIGNVPYGYKDILTEDESREVIKISGPKIKERLAALAEQPGFESFSENNQKIINRMVAEIRANAKLEVLFDR